MTADQPPPPAPDQTSPPQDAPQPEQRVAVRDMQATDDAIAARVASKFPAPILAVIGTMLTAAITAVIRRERDRCVEVINVGLRKHQRNLDAIEAQMQMEIARTAGQGSPHLDRMASARAACLVQINAFAQAARAVAIKPGSCYACGGTGEVPTAVVLAGNARGMAICQRCGGSGVMAPSPAAAPAPSNGSA